MLVLCCSEERTGVAVSVCATGGVDVKVGETEGKA